MLHQKIAERRISELREILHLIAAEQIDFASANCKLLPGISPLFCAAHACVLTFSTRGTSVELGHGVCGCRRCCRLSRFAAVHP
jgi:hypothetical protein